MTNPGDKAPTIETKKGGEINWEKYNLNDYLVKEMVAYGLTFDKTEKGLVIRLENATVVQSSEASEDLTKEKNILVPDGCVLKTPARSSDGFITLQILNIESAKADGAKIETYKIKTEYSSDELSQNRRGY